MSYARIFFILDTFNKMFFLNATSTQPLRPRLFKAIHLFSNSGSSSVKSNLTRTKSSHVTFTLRRSTCPPIFVQYSCKYPKFAVYTND